MGCGCGGQKTWKTVTAAEAEAQRQQDELSARIAEEQAKVAERPVS